MYLLGADADADINISIVHIRAEDGVRYVVCTLESACAGFAVPWVCVGCSFAVGVVVYRL